MNTPTPSKYQNRSIEDLKSSLHAINLKLDNLRMDAAITVGVLPLKPGRKFWVATEIDWNDSRLDPIRSEFLRLVDSAYELQKIINKLEAEANNTLTQWELYETIDEFLETNFKTFSEELRFYKRNNLTRGLSSLREECLRNPNYLDEVIL